MQIKRRPGRRAALMVFPFYHDLNTSTARIIESLVFLKGRVQYHIKIQLVWYVENDESYGEIMAWLPVFALQGIK